VPMVVVIMPRRATGSGSASAVVVDSQHMTHR
jgi:hypothetical protein